MPSSDEMFGILSPEPFPKPCFITGVRRLQLHSQLLQMVYKIVPHLQSNLTKLFSALSLRVIKSGSNLTKTARLTACCANQANRWMLSPPPGADVLSDAACDLAIRVRADTGGHVFKKFCHWEKKKKLDRPKRMCPIRPLGS